MCGIVATADGITNLGWIVGSAENLPAALPCSPTLSSDQVWCENDRLSDSEIRNKLHSLFSATSGSSVWFRVQTCVGVYI